MCFFFFVLFFGGGFLGYSAPMRVYVSWFDLFYTIYLTFKEKGRQF